MLINSVVSIAAEIVAIKPPISKIHGNVLASVHSLDFCFGLTIFQLNCSTTHAATANCAGY